jgi:hypothetical protein
MRNRRLLSPAKAVAVLAGSQVGHLVVSELRWGPGAAGPGGAGVHAYAPALATVSLGLAGATVLAALLSVAAARAVRGGGGAARPPARSAVLDVAAALFAAQLAIYVGQEILEAVAHGAPAPDVASLVLWGCAGQLPAAVLAALAVSWLSPRAEAAVIELSAAALGIAPALATARAWTSAPPALRRLPPAAPVTGRGPPALLCPR